MRRFEGKYRWTDGVFMLEFDDATGLVHQTWESGRTEVKPLDAFTSSLPGSLVRLIHGQSTGLSFAEAAVSAEAAASNTPWEQLIVAPGATLMMHTRRCERADFSPLAGRQVNLSDADLSGVVFGEIDFRPAALARTKFTYAAIDRGRFNSGQLAGLDLRNALLSKMDLRGHDLTGTQFDGAILHETKLVGARLERATFRGARLDMTDFSATNAAGVVFDGARGIFTRFSGATLEGATFVGARLGRPAFSGARLARVSFKDALLAEARFGATDGSTAADLTSVDFDGADLQSADFTAATLMDCKVPARPPRFGDSVDRRTRFVRASVPSFLLGNDWSYIDATDATIALDAAVLSSAPLKAVHAVLPKINFGAHELAQADFRSAQLREARFGGCMLEEARFDEAVLEGADFTSANIEGANFSGANLQSAVFAQAWVRNARFERSMLSNTNFSSAMLAEVNFSGIQGRSLAGVNFARACLVSADFRDVDAPRAGSTRTTFSAACLAGANFTGATLSDVMLTDAQLSAGAGSITIAHPWQSSTRPYRFQRTRLLPQQTGPDTTCPDGRSGMCSVERLTSREVPEKWSP